MNGGQGGQLATQGHYGWALRPLECGHSYEAAVPQIHLRLAGSEMWGLLFAASAPLPPMPPALRADLVVLKLSYGQEEPECCPAKGHLPRGMLSCQGWSQAVSEREPCARQRAPRGHRGPQGTAQGPPARCPPCTCLTSSSQLPAQVRSFRLWAPAVSQPLPWGCGQ